MMKNKQVGGVHYKQHAIQPWDIIDEYELNYYEGNALKYILRSKGDRVEDLQKAIHYLEKEIELLDNDYQNLLDDDEHQANIEKLDEPKQTFDILVDGRIFKVNLS